MPVGFAEDRGGFQRRGGLTSPSFGVFFFPYSFCANKKNMAVGDQRSPPTTGEPLDKEEVKGGGVMEKRHTVAKTQTTPA